VYTPKLVLPDGLVKLFDKEFVNSVGVVEVEMMPCMGDDDGLAPCVASFSEVLDRVNSSLGIHPIMVTIDKRYGNFDSCYAINNRQPCHRTGSQEVRNTVLPGPLCQGNVEYVIMHLASLFLGETSKSTRGILANDQRAKKTTWI